jgi:hypothetical protein
MYRFTAALAVVAALASAAPAGAHKADPHYLTRVDAILPQTPGVSVTVINRSDQLELHNTSGKDVIIGGYNDDQYARVMADGSVAVNHNSPAYYLNQDRYGAVDVPAGVDGSGPPKWVTLDKTGRFAWHDHRMHWMVPNKRPQQVTDPDRRTKIFTWKVPLTVGGRSGDIDGTLFWTPEPGAPVGFMIVGSVVVLALCAGALVIRRRRDREAGGAPPAEAW